MKDKPFWLVGKPRVANTKAVLVEIDDHLGKESVHVNTWWSGEGITVSIDETTPQQKTREFDLTWTELDAIKLAVKAINKE